jgi:hypothetical protein
MRSRRRDEERMMRTKRESVRTEERKYGVLSVSEVEVEQCKKSAGFSSIPSISPSLKFLQ